MTSELENVMRAQLEVKTNDLKQIAVSTANLTPDETGLAPLEKQTAFTPVEEAVVSTPEVPTESNAIPSEPVTTISNPEPVSQPITEAPQDLTNPIVPPMEHNTEQVPTSVTNGEALESIDYSKPNDDILTSPPVDVVGATGLDQMNISSFVDKSLEGLSQLGEKEVVEEKPVEKMEMPVMDQEINAQEPTGQDDRLFEGAHVDMVNSTMAPVGDTPFTVPPMNNQEVNPEIEQDLVNPMEMVAESITGMPTVETEQQSADSQVNPVDSINPMEDGLNPFAEQPVPVQETSEPVFDNSTPMPMDTNPTSAFDDHLKMPDDLPQSFSYPTADAGQLDAMPIIENPQLEETPAMQENVFGELPTIDTNPTAELPTMGGELNFATPVEEPTKLERNDTQPEVGADLNEKMDIILAKLDALSEEIKAMNQPNKLTNAPTNTLVEPPMGSLETSTFEQPNTMVGFQQIGVPEPNSEMMSIDEEPVHGKFMP